jgi:hypothetical protein
MLRIEVITPYFGNIAKPINIVYGKSRVLNLKADGTCREHCDLKSEGIAIPE